MPKSSRNTFEYLCSMLFELFADLFTYSKDKKKWVEIIYFSSTPVQKIVWWKIQIRYFL